MKENYYQKYNMLIIFQGNMENAMQLLNPSTMIHGVPQEVKNLLKNQHFFHVLDWTHVVLNHCWIDVAYSFIFVLFLEND